MQSACLCELARGARCTNWPARWRLPPKPWITPSPATARKATIKGITTLRIEALMAVLIDPRCDGTQQSADRAADQAESDAAGYEAACIVIAISSGLHVVNTDGLVVIGSVHGEQRGDCGHDETFLGRSCGGAAFLVDFDGSFPGIHFDAIQPAFDLARCRN